MKIFAISDLHLSFSYPVDPLNWEEVKEYKPMGDIDKAWTDHARLLYDNWVSTVKEEDLVLVAGDISWAMKLEEAYPDLDFLGKLPGKIVAIQGNHDYWWQSISRVREAAPSNMNFIQNDFHKTNGLGVCGTRGWLCPKAAYFKEHDQKIYNRELIRMENSLKSMSRERDSLDKIIVMMHYMPTNEKHDYSGFIELFQHYNIKKVVYGHLHARACKYRLPDFAWGINFILTSADYLGFKPYLLGEL